MKKEKKKQGTINEDLIKDKSKTGIFFNRNWDFFSGNKQECFEEYTTLQCGTWWYPKLNLISIIHFSNSPFSLRTQSSKECLELGRWVPSLQHTAK